MGESRKVQGFFGEYTEHFDDDGKKIGESREREGFFGRYTEHTDTSGRTVAESREREGFFGRYTEHTSSSGERLGTSHRREGIFGPYTEHSGSHDGKVGESRVREGLLGRYQETHGSLPYIPGSSDTSKSADGSSSASLDMLDIATGPSSCDYVVDSQRQENPVAPVSILVVLSFVFVLAFMGWSHYSQEQGRRNQMLEQFHSLMASAGAHAASYRFEEAERKYAQAYNVALEIGRDYQRQVYADRASNYEVISISGGGEGVYSVQGAAFTKLENPLVCLRDPARCGAYHFRIEDQSRLFASRNDVAIDVSDGRVLSLRDGMHVSDIFPVGTEFCCSQSLNGAAPRLVFRPTSGLPSSVYVSRQ